MNTKSFFNFFVNTFLFGIILLCLVGISAYSVKAQPGGGNPSADIDQCRNGAPGDPDLPCNNANYVNGNLNPQNSSYYEGSSVPYRIKFNNLVVGTTYTITIDYGTTKNGKHAIDYLTSYDRTETQAMGNNPCDGIAGCSLTTTATYQVDTFPIPLDPQVAARGVTQIPGVFTLFGGDITAVSGYTIDGSYAADSDTEITITFIAGTTNPVLAFGAHIARLIDYPVEGSASLVSGSPYHVGIKDFSGGSGAQDRSLRVSQLAPTAATAMVSGRIRDVNGKSVSRVTITLTNLSNGEAFTTRTNLFGRYTFEDMPTGQNYLISASSKRHVFSLNEVVINLLEDLTDANFTAIPNGLMVSTKP
ncbi:MAG: carboxypeptidase regulatory-like domain-containing protein [Acidobacteria bacterium]|jgi:hypothetical protein|nr:carboxypeptidase regulatory-like domain-containing protein [Acidobacteriota bacterium]